MREIVADILSKHVKLGKKKIVDLIEIPPSQELGDYAFPCFSLAKIEKKNPVQIASELSKKIRSNEFEKVEAKGPYINFFFNRKDLSEKTIKEILKQKDKYGSTSEGKGKKIVVDMSSPNIAKPFGIGHLRSTIRGNSLAKIHSYLGYKSLKLNYLGDWGTQFGKMIVGYKHFGNESKLKKDPIKYMLELYIKGNDEKYEDEARLWFKKLEDGDKEAISLWKKFKELSVKDFEKVYSILDIKFDEISK